MSQPLTKNQIKQRISKYGILIAYCGVGMVTTALFSYKLVRIRLENMENIKTKSRIPVLHKNMKRMMFGGLLSACLYTYGLYRIIMQMPHSETNRQMRDESFMVQQRRKNPYLQDLYIIKSLKMFGVKEQLIEKVKKQFEQMDPEGKFHEKAGIKFNTDLFWALIDRRKVEKQYLAKQNSNSNNKK